MVDSSCGHVPSLGYMWEHIYKYKHIYIYSFIRSSFLSEGLERAPRCPKIENCPTEYHRCNPAYLHIPDLSQQPRVHQDFGSAMTLYPAHLHLFFKICLCLCMFCRRVALFLIDLLTRRANPDVVVLRIANCNVRKRLEQPLVSRVCLGKGPNQMVHRKALVLVRPQPVKY